MKFEQHNIGNKIENYRIEIRARESVYYGRLTDSEKRSALEDRMSQIKRHVDFNNVEEPVILFDYIQRCKYCNSSNPNCDDGSPACCMEAQDEFEKLYPDDFQNSEAYS